MEQPLAGELTAAQGQQAPGLLPSGPQGVQVVVKHHHEPLLHIVRDLVQLPQQVKRRAAAQQGDDEPPGRHSGHKGHGREDEDIHQGAAHVRGDDVVKPHHQQHVPRQKRNGTQGFQPPVLLDPNQLPAEHQDERQLHDLRRLDIGRKALDPQPGPVAVVFDAQRRFQQQEHDDAEAQQPFPALGGLGQVDLGHEKIDAHSQHNGAGLDDDHLPGIQKARGAGNHHQPEQGRAAAKTQQKPVGLPQNIENAILDSFQHERLLL